MCNFYTHTLQCGGRGVRLRWFKLRGSRSLLRSDDVQTEVRQRVFAAAAVLRAVEWSVCRYLGKR
jgi:hypothetical protein